MALVVFSKFSFNLLISIFKLFSSKKYFLSIEDIFFVNTLFKLMNRLDIDKKCLAKRIFKIFS